MTVSYDRFTEGFLDKLTEYRFMEYSNTARQEMVDNYMKRACSQFGDVCKYDIINGDDENRVFTMNGITEGELIEIVDIVSEGMLVQWMKPYVFAQKNIETMLITVDHSFHSQAEILHRIITLYSTCAKNFKQLIREYSYRHGDLSSLHL